jgi:hypothetical protein
MATEAYVYKLSEPGLWTVGHYEPGTNKWIPESDHDQPTAAADRCNAAERRDDRPGQGGGGVHARRAGGEVVKQELRTLAGKLRLVIHDRPKATPNYFVKELADVLKLAAELENFTKERL